MNGKSLTKEYIEIVKEDENKHYKDYKKAVEKVAKSNAKYKGKPVPFLYQPMFFTEKDVINFNRIGDILMPIANKVIDKYLESPEYRKLFGYSDLLEELILVDPGYNTYIPISRFDLFYEDEDKFKFIEINTDGSSGMNEDNLISKVLLETEPMKKMKEKYNIDYFELVDKWVDESLKTYSTYNKKVDKPNVAIVDFKETGISAEFEEFQKAYIKKGYNAKIVDPRDLEYKDGKLYGDGMRIDLIYRRIVTVEFIEKADEIPELIEAYKDGAVCVIGSLRSQIMHNKIIFKILHDEETLEFLIEEERNFIKNHIPYTKELSGGKDIFSEILKNKNKYIIKPMDSFASQGVYAGVDFTGEEWKDILEKSWDENYLFQEFITPYTRPFVEFENEKLQVADYNLNIGVYMYNEKFAGAYTRISKDTIIFGQEGYYSIPNMMVKRKY